jgi:hypothetical protein
MKANNSRHDRSLETVFGAPGILKDPQMIFTFLYGSFDAMYAHILGQKADMTAKFSEGEFNSILAASCGYLISFGVCKVISVTDWLSPTCERGYFD